MLGPNAPTGATAETSKPRTWWEELVHTHAADQKQAQQKPMIPDNAPRSEIIITALRDANGDSCFHIVRVKGTEGDYNEGRFYEAARLAADAAGFEAGTLGSSDYGPAVHFDRLSPGWPLVAPMCVDYSSPILEVQALKQPTVLELAEEFSMRLRSSLRHLMPAVVWKNDRNKEEGSECCASHDFCDANMVMHTALVNLIHDDPSEFNVLDHLELINKAWDLAKSRHFFVAGADEFINIARENE